MRRKTMRRKSMHRKSNRRAVRRNRKSKMRGGLFGWGKQAVTPPSDDELKRQRQVAEQLQERKDAAIKRRKERRKERDQFNQEEDLERQIRVRDLLEADRRSAFRAEQDRKIGEKEDRAAAAKEKVSLTAEQNRDIQEGDLRLAFLAEQDR